VGGRNAIIPPAKQYLPVSRHSMRIFLHTYIVFIFCGCVNKSETRSKTNISSPWTEVQKQKYFSEKFAFRYGWGDGYFQNDTAETFLHFLKTHYPEVKSYHFHDAFLYALQEPYIDTTHIDSSKEWLRLVVTESFSNPYCFVLEKRNGKAYFTTKVTDGIGGQYTGNLRFSWTWTYEEKTYDSLFAQLQSLKFWHLPILDTSCHGGTDGSRWTIEAVELGKYQYIQRWSPEHCGDSLTYRLGQFGVQLKKLSRMDAIINAATTKNGG